MNVPITIDIGVLALLIIAPAYLALVIGFRVGARCKKSSISERVRQALDYEIEREDD